MSGKGARSQSVPSLLLRLWQQGFFVQERTTVAIARELSSIGSNPTPQNLNIALSRVTFLTRRGTAGHYRFIQKNAPKPVAAGTDVLPPELTVALEKDFKTELADLKHNFGVSGTCTAFLLRKILEKLIYIAFAAHGQEAVLLDANGQIVGLKTMLNQTVSCKVAGKPFLTSKTADEIQGLKFLGDTAAHNPLTKVSMHTIEPTMPYIVTAYSELVTKLS